MGYQVEQGKAKNYQDVEFYLNRMRAFKHARISATLEVYTDTGKAYYSVYSYNTLIATMVWDMIKNESIEKMLDNNWYSVTTGKHQGYIARAFGIIQDIRCTILV